MKKTAVLLGTLSLIFGLITPAVASLVGDDVLVQYLEAGSVVQGNTVIVEDSVKEPALTAWGTASVDMGASGVEISFLWNNAFADGSQFSGIQISGMNDKNPDWILLDVSVKTDMAGWTDDRIEFGYDETGSWVSFAWQGLGWEQNQSFDAMFTFGPSPMPIPATMVLFVTGLVGFVVIRRKLNS